MQSPWPFRSVCPSRRIFKASPWPMRATIQRLCGFAVSDRGLAAEPLDQGVGGERAADVEALHHVAAHAGQDVPALAVLDTFGDYGEPEVVRQTNGGAHDRDVVLVAGDVPHERAIDLQFVDRQTLQVAQRGVARAKVIDRAAYAHRAQLTQNIDGALSIGHDRALGDLQLQAAGATFQRSSSRATRSGSCASNRSRVERLTETGRNRSASCQARDCRSASLMTQRPSARIKPVFSASGMNSSGGTIPRCGCTHRTSASVPITLPVRNGTFGW